MKLCPTLLTASLLAAPAFAQTAAKAPPTLADVVKAAPAADWRALDPENTLYLDLPGGRVILELAPAFAPKNVANIKALVREKYFDGLVILRSQDNYVVQWGDPDEKTPRGFGKAAAKVEQEFDIAIPKGQKFTALKEADVYAAQTGHVDSLPAARDPKAGKTWLTHCYAMVGVARGNESDSGNGSSLYVVNGHAPRQLDRNVTLVGRVMQGMDLLSTMPRGTGALGFYEKPEQQVPIRSLRIAADLPAAERVALEVLRSDSPSYAAALGAARHRGGDWYKHSPERVELCNAPVVVRPVKAL